MKALLITVWLGGVLGVHPLLGQSDEVDVGTYLSEIQAMSEAVLQASQAAAEAGSVADVKAKADEVFTLIWGAPSGLAADSAHGAAYIHGWKVRWQVDNTEFDEAFAERYGTLPPSITNPKELGIMGRGLAVRDALQAIADSAETDSTQQAQAESVIASLNNVIGWMKMDDGVTKGERQPRVDLTRKWDAPSAFWQSTADTGWLHEVFSQALNLLKVDYEGDAAEARQHAEGLVMLAERVLAGLDADENGTVEPVMMEGGVNVALAQARAAGWVGP